MDNKNVYRCYNNTLKDYFIKNDIRYFLVAKDIVTDQKFYAFEKTDIFLDALKKWEENNPKNKI